MPANNNGGVEHRNTTDKSLGAAGVIAPPPLLYLVALLLGFIAQLIHPFQIASSVIPRYLIATLFFAASAGFARWAFVTMRIVGTSASPREQSTKLVTHGPFRWSRNPIYLAMTGMYIGISIFGNSWWPLMLLLPLVIIMQRGVILREERYLEQEFGSLYLDYRRTARRWL